MSDDSTHHDRRKWLALTLVTDDAALTAEIQRLMVRSDRVRSLSHGQLLRTVEALDEGALAELIAQSDAVLFDWDLMQAPVLARLQQHIGWSDVPLVMLCADPAEREAALLGGGDVAITRPYTRLLFSSLILALHRRMRSWHVLQAAQSPYAGLEHDAVSRAEPASEERSGIAQQEMAIVLLPRTLSVRIGDTSYVLTPRRFQLLSYLVENAGQVVSRDDILSDVWPTAADTGSNTIDVYVHHLRRLLRESRFQGRLETIRNVGYRLVYSS